MSSPKLLFLTVDSVTVTEYLADVALCDQEVLVSLLLVAWSGVLGCVQAEFFTSIGMCPEEYHLPEQYLAQVPGRGSLTTGFEQGEWDLQSCRFPL